MTDRVRADLDRAARCGIPELVLAEGKSDDDLLAAVDAMIDDGACIATRLGPDRADLVLDRHPDATYHEEARVLVAGDPAIGDLGTLAVIGAGTSDAPVLEEAATVADALGADVERVLDVGVAGVHRLYRALDDLDRGSVDAWIVCAGREGALPTVVAGMVRGPVIGVPVSTGYGAGGGGEAALMAMLQSCAPLAVVNVDAGAVAAAVAVQTMARITEARREAIEVAE